MTYIKTTLKILAAPIIVLLVHFIIVPFNTYAIYPWIDVPMHFIGGLSIGIATLTAINIFQKKEFIPKFHNFFLFIIIISVVSLTAVSWEFFEFMLDFISPIKFQDSLKDTMFDLFLGLVGGMSSYSMRKLARLSS